MNGRDKERSFSEVGDTLRYFNSMASSHSWCCSEYENSVTPPLISKATPTSYSFREKATPTSFVAVKAMALATAVSGESYDHFNDATSISSDGGIVILSDINTTNEELDTVKIPRQR